MGKPVQESKVAPQAKFDPRAFSKLIQDKGLEYLWSRALNCPCQLNPQTKQWDVACTRCGGDGWMYVNPCHYTEQHLNRDWTPVRAIFSTVKTGDTTTDILGEWSDGRATLTVQNEMRVGYRDRFIGIQQEIAFSEVLERGPDTVPIGSTTSSPTTVLGGVWCTSRVRTSTCKPSGPTRPSSWCGRPEPGQRLANCTWSTTTRTRCGWSRRGPTTFKTRRAQRVG